MRDVGTDLLYLHPKASRIGVVQADGTRPGVTEVPSLAQRSSQAAKKIRQLIDSSAEQVVTGEKLVALASETMARVVTAPSQAGLLLK